MRIPASAFSNELTRHVTPKQVIVRGGVLPGVPQVAIAEFAAGQATEPHVHETMYEIYYVLEGQARYYIGGEIVDAEPGDFLVVPPGTVHHQEITSTPHRVFYWES